MTSENKLIVFLNSSLESKYILYTKIYFDSLGEYSYQYLAADVNKDGRVSAADALSVLKTAVGLPASIQPEWDFVAETYDFWDEINNQFNISASNIDWASIESHEITNSNMTNYVGVLSGDVNGSWASAGATVLDDSYFESLVDLGLGPLDQWWAV